MKLFQGYLGCFRAKLAKNKTLRKQGGVLFKKIKITTFQQALGLPPAAVMRLMEIAGGIAAKCSKKCKFDDLEWIFKGI